MYVVKEMIYVVKVIDIVDLDLVELKDVFILVSLFVYC